MSEVNANPPTVAVRLSRREPVLAVRGLTVSFPAHGRDVRPVEGVDLDVFPGETLALVGESGCGKSLTALSLLGLCPMDAVVGGTVQLNGRGIASIDRNRIARLRGSSLGMIFQEPTSSLNPVMRIGDQLVLALRAHRRLTRREARVHALELLDGAGIADVERRIDQYPHEWSGGMCQRAMIALALANEPMLLIADEPTTALDVTVQAQVLDLLRAKQRAMEMSILLITHDLGVVAEIADRVAVMYSGRIVEQGRTADVLAQPQHPYTVGLLACQASMTTRAVVTGIPGQPPDPAERPTGCAFHPRCPVGRDLERCRTRRPELRTVPGTPLVVACHEPGSAVAPVGVPKATNVDRVDVAPILRVTDLVVSYAARHRGVRRPTPFDAVRGASFEVVSGRTLGIVGESGCGKSSVAAAITRLIEPRSGRIEFDGRDLRSISGRALREVRRGLQIVFQDPHAALDPRMTVGESVAEPIRIHGVGEPSVDVGRLLELVGVRPVDADRYPHELSGGQLQRINIARALALDPRVVVLDEPVSSLDVSVQAQILELLLELQRRLGVAYLFISHDLSVVRQVANSVAVMYLGDIVESGDVDDVFDHPRHPYTRSLIDAVPRLDRQRIGTGLGGEVPSPLHPPAGCAFSPRCPHSTDLCLASPPQLLYSGASRRVACHHPLGDPN